MNYVTEKTKKNQEVPIVDSLYDLYEDEYLNQQTKYESEVRSYPRRLPLAIKKASGLLVEDTKGQVYLDCLAGAGTLALGHNHAEIKDELKRYLDLDLPSQTLDLTTGVKNVFMQEVLDTLPTGFKNCAKVQFCGPSGADAVEAAIKLAKRVTNRNNIIAFSGAYHGMTNGSMSLMGNNQTKARSSGLMADVHFMPFPYSLRCPFGLGGDDGAKMSLRYLERTLNDDESGILKPAAIIVEPVQGEGGVLPAPLFWLKELRRITEEHGILLIFDEIQCGIGKTGSWFAFENSNIFPDILCLSKAVGGGLPLSLLILNEKYDDWRPGEHTGTFRGNQLAMVAGLKTFEIIRRDNLVEHAKVAGNYFKNGLNQLASKFSCIAEVRGRGLMLGIEIVSKKGSLNKFSEPMADEELTRKIQRGCLQRGLIIEKGGRNGSVLRFLPPLNITYKQIDFVLDVLENVLLNEVGINTSNRLPKHESLDKFFIHTGKGGADLFQESVSIATENLIKVFNDVRGPYSGMMPSVLKSVIDSFDISKEGRTINDVMRSSASFVAKNSIIVQHPNCIAHLHTPPLITGVVSELFIAALNQSMDSWDQASAATFVEQKVIQLVNEHVGYNSLADGIFTSGGTQSNLMGILLARDKFIDKLSGHNVKQHGLPNYHQRLKIICSETAHFTVQKSAALLGLGFDSVETISVDVNGKMDIYELNNKILHLKNNDFLPFMIVGTAGTTDEGAIDPLLEQSKIAEKHDLWFHVDAAYGGSLIFSSRRKMLEGIYKADSITLDFHKLFYQPISCGAFLIRNRENFNYLLHHADYLNRENDKLPNLVDKSIATTRRFDALKVLLSLQHVGLNNFGRMYDNVFDLTNQLANFLEGEKHIQVLRSPQLSTILFRFIDSEIKDLNKLNCTIREMALEDGVAILGETKVDGNVSLKVTILNPCIKLQDLTEMFKQLNILFNKIKREL